MHGQATFWIPASPPVRTFRPLLAALDAHVPEQEPVTEPKTWVEIYDESGPDDEDVAFWVDNACSMGTFTMEQRQQIFAVL